MKVFIADVTARFRNQLIELLSEIDTVEVVGQAGDVGTALSAIRSLRPDVVMVDIQLSEGSGVELLRKLRREDKVVVAIMMTNHASHPYRKACTRAGADFLFDKANEINEVKKVIQNLLPRFGRALA
jgi:DNA-binding NarL/FixJ family response regulator